MLSDRLLLQTGSTKQQLLAGQTAIFIEVNTLSIMGNSTLTAIPSSMVSPTLIWIRRPNKAFMPRSFNLFISWVWSSYSRNGRRLLMDVAFPSPWAFFLVRHSLQWGGDAKNTQMTYYICQYAQFTTRTYREKHCIPQCNTFDLSFT